MRIGVVCEGQTDLIAIEAFFGDALRRGHRGRQPRFLPIQPTLDNTRPDGGWGQVILWLQNNSPAMRVQKYFSGGLFGGNLQVESLDAILFQIDTDILDDESFRSYISQNFGYQVKSPLTSADRANEVRSIIHCVGKFVELSYSDTKRHIVVPAVESTEAWCVAAFRMPIKNCESLKGQNLIDEFMTALEKSEGRPAKPPYTMSNKDVMRRRQFCDKHINGSKRIRQACPSFERAYTELSNLL